MSSIQAESFVRKAEAAEEAGQVDQACHWHFRAAEAYMDAVSETRNEDAAKSLRMMSLSHTKRAKELKMKDASRRESTPLPRGRERAATAPASRLEAITGGSGSAAQGTGQAAARAGGAHEFDERSPAGGGGESLASMFTAFGSTVGRYTENIRQSLGAGSPPSAAKPDESGSRSPARRPSTSSSSGGAMTESFFMVPSAEQLPRSESPPSRSTAAMQSLNKFTERVSAVLGSPVKRLLPTTSVGVQTEADAREAERCHSLQAEMDETREMCVMLEAQYEERLEAREAELDKIRTELRVATARAEKAEAELERVAAELEKNKIESAAAIRAALTMSTSPAPGGSRHAARLADSVMRASAMTSASSAQSQLFYSAELAPEAFADATAAESEAGGEEDEAPVKNGAASRQNGPEPADAVVEEEAAAADGAVAAAASEDEEATAAAAAVVEEKETAQPSAASASFDDVPENDALGHEDDDLGAF